MRGVQQGDKWYGMVWYSMNSIIINNQALEIAKKLTTGMTTDLFMWSMDWQELHQ
jgi:hypothetical protein